MVSDFITSTMSDELAEISRNVLESLRQPLEEQKIVLSRLSGDYTFPADFLFVAAANGCPCGAYPDMNRCVCTRAQIDRYRSRISQPLLERIDLCVARESMVLALLHDAEPREAFDSGIVRAGD